MNYMEKWPNFFIVGTPRAGTTTLYDFLKRTEGVFMSSHKEPHYFSSIESSSLYPPPIRDKKKYLSLFNKVKKEKAVGEASTSYLWDPNAPKLIHEDIPNAKIIISLRDPVERAYSHYLLRLSGGKTYSFSEAIRKALMPNVDFYTGVIVIGGWYHKEINRYLNFFGKEKVKIMIFEEFVIDPKKTINEVLKFLEVQEEPPQAVELVHNYLTKPRNLLTASILKNKTVRRIARDLLPTSIAVIGVRRILGKKITKPSISQQDRIFLENLYRNDVRKLQKTLGRKLPWKWVNN